MSEELQQLQQDSIIELFELDTTNVNGTLVIRFCNEIETDGTSVFLNTVEYLPVPVQAQGFEIDSQSLPNPTISVSNQPFEIEGNVTTVSQLCLSNDDFIGAKLTRTRIHQKHLDNGLDPNPGRAFPNEVFFVEQKSQENVLTVSFRLTSSLSLGNFTLPERKLLRNYCPWVYRGEVCQYAGPDKDLNNNPTTNPEEDQCNKTFEACRCRFNTTGDVLPFGGFPGLSQI